MRITKRSFGLVSTLLLAVAAIGLTALQPTPAQAAEGYWAFQSYATTPPQAQLDAIARANAPRVFEQHVSGAFQPAESGAGSIDLSFKTDDVDRRLYLTTLKFSFTTGVEMRVLNAGQRIRFRGVLEMGGNALSKAIPADGTGTISADNGDYFVNTAGGIDRVGNGEGDLVVPSGSPGAVMTIHVQGHLGSYGALTGTMDLTYVWRAGPPPVATAHPSPGPAADAIGSRLEVNELNGLWIGVWTRRPGSNIFDAVWHSAQYPEVRDVIRLQSIRGRQVVFSRDGNGGTYYGTLSADGRSIAGTASWYTSGMSWSARLSGH